MARFTKAKDTRRLGRDQEEGLEELHEMLDDPEVSAGELIAALIELCPPEKEEELHGALREMGEDRRRGPRGWARDKLERRRLGKDARRGRDRRMGRDLSAEELTAGSLSRSIEEFDRSDNRDSYATVHDMVMDARAKRDSDLAGFRRRYPGATRMAPSTCRAGSGECKRSAVSIEDLLPTDAPDFRPDLECLGPRSSMLRSSNG
jgi:hypothetical protein